MFLKTIQLVHGTCCVKADLFMVKIDFGNLEYNI